MIRDSKVFEYEAELRKDITMLAQAKESMESEILRMGMKEYYVALRAYNMYAEEVKNRR